MPHGFPASEPSFDGFELSLANEQSNHAVNESQLLEAARSVLRDSEYSAATVSLAIVDDPTIHELNRRFLDHDWPTDVLSFVLEQSADRLEGEVVLSADTAAAAAREFGTTPAAEQLLYVIHGLLHLVGYDDQTEAEAQEMRAAERLYLRQFGVEMPAEDSVRAVGGGGTIGL